MCTVVHLEPEDFARELVHNPKNVYARTYVLDCGLAVVPGVIKAYEYSMIPYLLAENPNLSASEAFSLSKQMTTGQKADLFVLDLSFLGWIILGALCCGIGLLFVQPYPEATKAEVYLILKQKI